MEEKKDIATPYGFFFFHSHGSVENVISPRSSPFSLGSSLGKEMDPSSRLLSDLIDVSVQGSPFFLEIMNFSRLAFGFGVGLGPKK